MRVLVIPPDTSHFSAMVALCRALRAGGNKVLVAGTADKVEGLRTTGLSTIAVPVPEAEGPGFTPDESWFPAVAMADRDSEAGAAVWGQMAMGMAMDAERELPGLLEAARRWSPDVVVTDPLSLAGLPVARAVGAAAVSFRWGVDPTAGAFARKGEELLAPMCERLGLDGVPGPDLVLDPCPSSLQDDRAVPGRRLRYIPWNGAGSVPGWVFEDKVRPRIAVCMGGRVLKAAGARPLVNALAAAEGSGADVVVALADEDRNLLPRTGDRVRIAGRLPLSVFLDTCDLIVHHGGSGNGLTAAAHGVPQLTMPQMADAFAFGQKIAASGAGIDVPDAAGQADTAGLRRAVEALLEDERHRKAASRLRDEVEAAPTPDSAVAALEELVGSRHQRKASR